jgi:hypothetical protein
MMFLGCCLGDHTKTAIGTKLNTGTVAGVACNLFGASFHPAHIADFVWGQPGNYKAHRLENAIATARTVMGRRHVEMTSEYEQLIRLWFDQSKDQRDLFLSRRMHGGRKR